MMRIFASLLGLALLHSVTAQNPPDDNLTHYVFFKSFDTSIYECAQLYQVSNCTLQSFAQNGYPNDPIVPILVHCALVNLGAWTDGPGYIESALHYLFNPDVEDTCYKNRTRECIKATVQPSDNNSTAAYKVFQCYYRQYGNLNQTGQNIPYRAAEWPQLILASIAIVSVPFDEVVRYSQGSIVDQPHFAELLYVILLRGGFYRQSDGFQTAMLFSQFGDRELLTNETHQCITAQAAATQGLSYKEQVKAGFLKCLKNICSEVLYWIQATSKGIVAVPSASCAGNSIPQPPCSTTTTAAAPCTTTTTCSPLVTKSPYCNSVK